MRLQIFVHVIMDKLSAVSFVVPIFSVNWTTFIGLPSKLSLVTDIQGTIEFTIMRSELREVLEKHLFHYSWSDSNGGERKVFPSSDIRCREVGDKDFTLQASSLKEALEKIEEKNFAVCPSQASFLPSHQDPGKRDPMIFYASGCPPTFPTATEFLAKRVQKGGTGGEEDFTSFHSKAPWKITFQHETKSITWDLVQIVKSSCPSLKDMKDGTADGKPSMSGTIQSCTVLLDSPQQHLLKSPLRGEMKEKARIRRAIKDSQVYLLGNPHKGRRRDSGAGKIVDCSSFEADPSQDMSRSPKKVWRHLLFILSLLRELVTLLFLLTPSKFIRFHSARCNYVLKISPLQYKTLTHSKWINTDEQQTTKQ